MGITWDVRASDDFQEPSVDNGNDRILNPHAHAHPRPEYVLQSTKTLSSDPTTKYIVIDNDFTRIHVQSPHQFSH